MANTKKNQKKDDAQTWALDKFNESWDYATQTLHGKWDENWKLFNNIRVKRKHDGLIKTFVPMVNSSINTLVAALYNSTPRFNFVPDTSDQEEDTKILTEIIDDFSMKDGWAQKNRENGQNTMITGSGPMYYQWSEDRITKEVIAVRDFICDPMATSWTNWRYAGRRYFVTKSQLEDQTILDPETGEFVPRYKNLEKCEGMDGSSDYLSDKEIKDATLGQSSLGMKGKIEVIEIWDKERVVTLAGREIVIEDVPNPYLQQENLIYESLKAEWEWQRQIVMLNENVDIGEYAEPFTGEGMIPFALGRCYIDSSLIYGTSDVDIIKDQQELLNDLKEMNVEAILYQLYPEKSLDPKFAAWSGDLSPKPGKVYPFPANAMVWNNPPVLPSNAFNEIATIKADIRESIAVDSIVKGVTSATQQTATEIKAQLGQSSQRIEAKAKILEDDFFFQEAKICLKLIRLYMRDKTMIRVLENTGVRWEEYDPSRFIGEYTPMVKLDITRELEKSKEQDTTLQAFEIMNADETNNRREVKRIMYPKMELGLTDEEINAIITPAQPQIPAPNGDASQPAGAMPAQGGAGMSMEMPAPLPAESMEVMA